MNSINPQPPSKSTKWVGYSIFGGIVIISIALMLAVILQKGQTQTPVTTIRDPETQKFTAVISQAATYDQATQYDKVAAELKTYVDSNPRNEEKLKATSQLAAAYLNDGDYDKAITTYETLSEYPEYKLSSIHGLALAYRSKGELQKAIDHYKEALAFMEANGKTDTVIYKTDKNVVSRLEQHLEQQQK